MTLSDDGGKPFERVSNAFRKAAEWLHAKKAFTPDMLSEPEPAELIKATHDVLASELSAIGFKIPDEMTQTLDDDIFLFSGFKTYHEMNDASRLLKDDDGGFKPFGSFLQDIQSIDSQYNRNYLYAEYNFAKASTQMAVKWHDIEKDGDDYNLQYHTASDGLVRPEHAALEGVTLPPSDKFWNEYYPPNGWNCRCTAVQVLKDKYAASDSDQACAAGERATTQIGRNGANKAEMFRFNPGKAGKIFPPKHPYYKAPEEVKKSLDLENKHREENRKEYERLKKDPNYRDVEYDAKSGGIKAEHIGHIVHEEKEERFFKEMTEDGKGLTSTQLERCCQDNIFRSGHKAILRNEKIYNSNGDQLPAVDLELDDKIMDIASITTAEKYGNRLMSKNRQLGNVKKQTGMECDSVCLYFHNADSFSEQRLKKDIDWYRQHIVEAGSHQRINHIYVVINKKEELLVFDL